MNKELIEQYVEIGVLRFEQLQKHGVAAVDEPLLRKQIGKLIGMTQGEFDDYLKERVELRKSVVAELEENNNEIS